MWYDTLTTTTGSAVIVDNTIKVNAHIAVYVRWWMFHGDVPGGVHEYDPTTRKGGKERQDELPLATRIQCVCVCVCVGGGGS